VKGFTALPILRLLHFPAPAAFGHPARHDPM